MNWNWFLREDGLSLLEVLASCAILALILVGLVGFTGTVRLSHSDDAYRTQASAAEDAVTASLMNHASSGSALTSYVSQINHQSVAALGLPGSGAPLENLYVSIAPVSKLDNGTQTLQQGSAVTDPGLPAHVRSVSQYNAITTGDGVFEVVVTVYWKE